MWCLLCRRQYNTGLADLHSLHGAGFLHGCTCMCTHGPLVYMHAGGHAALAVQPGCLHIISVYITT